jgi:hypothetical protein
LTAVIDSEPPAYRYAIANTCDHNVTAHLGQFRTTPHTLLESKGLQVQIPSVRRQSGFRRSGTLRDRLL